jgi:hypothetical protein
LYLGCPAALDRKALLTGRDPSPPAMSLIPIACEISESVL